MTIPPEDTIKTAASLVTRMGGTHTAEALVRPIRETLGERRIDLAVLFATAHFEDELDQLAADVHEQLRARVLIGMSGESILNADREFEGQPAITLWAAHLPETRIAPFFLTEEDLDSLNDLAQLPDLLTVPEGTPASFLLLGDPFTFNAPEFIDKLAQAYPDRPAIGGLASAGEEPGQNVLIFNGLTFRNGLVGVGIWGNTEVVPLVSQGCRPIGHHMVITKAEKNVIRELGGQPPLFCVKELLETCSESDLKLLRERGLLVGRVIDEHRESFSRGDFLVRNPLGFDPNSGAMAITDLVRPGQTIQFHVRDSRSATEDLESALAHADTDVAAGALVFSCNGRGRRLFPQPHHDARTVHDACSGHPIAGVFCAGEIGPIGARNFLHGFTASIALFCAPAPKPDQAPHG